MWAAAVPRYKAICIPIGRYWAVQAASRHGFDHNEFMSWLLPRNDDGDLSTLRIATSHSFGRGLFAKRPIRTGEPMLEVSQNLMITPHDLPEEVDKLLPENVKPWTKLALFILMESHKGQTSDWSPYISCLPQRGELDNVFLWENKELDYLKESLLYRKAHERLDMVKGEFETVEEVFSLWPQLFGKTTLEDFKHVYATVFSRALAIGEGPTLVMIPMLDFINHNPNSSAALSYNGILNLAVVTSDREYHESDQVWISYGDLSNVELALDYGFTTPDNPYDAVELLMHISENNILHQVKLQLKSLHGEEALLSREVKSHEECPHVLHTMGQHISKEVISLEVSDQIKRLQSSLLEIEHEFPKLRIVRKEIAERVLNGELRVLQSARNWFDQNHIKSVQ